MFRAGLYGDLPRIYREFRASDPRCQQAYDQGRKKGEYDEIKIHPDEGQSISASSYYLYQDTYIHAGICSSRTFGQPRPAI